MLATVTFLPLPPGTSEADTLEGLRRILNRPEITAVLENGGLTAIKMHFGEADKPRTVSPAIVKEIARASRRGGGKPFLADTNTLYTGKRSNTVDHLITAHGHGYTYPATTAPVVILDGLAGKNFQEVPINLKHCRTAKIARDVLSIDTLICLTHVTGHIETGLGASIKNIGMGLASRGGKQAQHSGILPVVNKKKCTACGECAKWCPVHAIAVDKCAVIDPKVCVGCGECTVTCPVHAIAVRWDESSVGLQEKMAEYAFAVLRNIKGPALFINVILQVTKDCDCMGDAKGGELPPVGIVAATDIVAADQAAYDLMVRVCGRDPIKAWYGETDPLIQVRYAESIGLGTREYTLAEV
ncbi:MAG: DUF362 domain-containing protein [Planctomycetota bacterium]